MQNPFASPEPVTEPRRFYGRRGELQRIYARIGAERPQSVSVVGEASMGKSSFINALAHPETKDKYLPDPAKSIFGLMHLRERDDWTPQGFLHALTQAFREDRPGLPDVSDYDGFREMIQRLTSEGLSAIAFFDDFDVITQNPDFPLTFFSFMRSMANTYDVAYVTTSSESLQKLCTLKDVEESPFFNIFTTMALKPLTKPEVRQWVIETSNPTGVSLAGEVDWIYEQVGGFPIFVRGLCELLLDRKMAKGKLEGADREEVRAAFQEKIAERFESVWGGFDEAERSLCAHLLTSSDIARPQMHTVRELLRRGYVVEIDKQYQLLGRAFEVFVADKMGVALEESSAGGKRKWWRFWKT